MYCTLSTLYFFLSCWFQFNLHDHFLTDVFYSKLVQIVCEVPGGTNWNFDVHWYPKVPGVISASSFDGKIGIYNIEVCLGSYHIPEIFYLMSSAGWNRM